MNQHGTAPSSRSCSSASSEESLSAGDEPSHPLIVVDPNGASGTRDGTDTQGTIFHFSPIHFETSTGSPKTARQVASNSARCQSNALAAGRSSSHAEISGSRSISATATGVGVGAYHSGGDHLHERQQAGRVSSTTIGAELTSFTSFDTVGSTTSALKTKRDSDAECHRQREASKALEVHARLTDRAKSFVAQREETIAAAEERHLAAERRKQQHVVERIFSRQMLWLRIVNVSRALATMRKRWGGEVKRMVAEERLLPLMRRFCRRVIRRKRLSHLAHTVQRPSAADLKRDKMLSLFSDAHLSNVLDRLTLRFYFPDETIIFMGLEEDEGFFLASGTADVLMGKTCVFTLRAGMAFGTVGMISGEPRTATVVARGPTLVWVVKRGDFESAGTNCEAQVQAAHVIIAELRQSNMRSVYKSILTPAFLGGCVALRDVSSDTVAEFVAAASPKILRGGSVLLRNTSFHPATQPLYLLRGTVRIYLVAPAPPALVSPTGSSISAPPTLRRDESLPDVPPTKEISLSLEEQLALIADRPRRRQGKAQTTASSTTITTASTIQASKNNTSPPTTPTLTRGRGPHSPSGSGKPFDAAAKKSLSITRSHGATTTTMTTSNDAIGDLIASATFVPLLPQGSSATQAGFPATHYVDICGPCLLNVALSLLTDHSRTASMSFCVETLGGCDLMVFRREKMIDADPLDLATIRHNVSNIHSAFFNVLSKNELLRALTPQAAIPHLPPNWISLHAVEGIAQRRCVYSKNDFLHFDSESRQEALLIVRGEAQGVPSSPRPLLWPDLSTVYFGCRSCTTRVTEFTEAIAISRADILHAIAESSSVQSCQEVASALCADYVAHVGTHPTFVDVVLSPGRRGSSVSGGSGGRGSPGATNRGTLQKFQSMRLATNKWSTKEALQSDEYARMELAQRPSLPSSSGSPGARGSSVGDHEPALKQMHLGKTNAAFADIPTVSVQVHQHKPVSPTTTRSTTNPRNLLTTGGGGSSSVGETVQSGGSTTAASMALFPPTFATPPSEMTTAVGESSASAVVHSRHTSLDERAGTTKSLTRESVVRANRSPRPHAGVRSRSPVSSRDRSMSMSSDASASGECHSYSRGETHLEEQPFIARPVQHQQQHHHHSGVHTAGGAVAVHASRNHDATRAHYGDVDDARQHNRHSTPKPPLPKEARGSSLHDRRPSASMSSGEFGGCGSRSSSRASRDTSNKSPDSLTEERLERLLELMHQQQHHSTTSLIDDGRGEHGGGGGALHRERSAHGSAATVNAQRYLPTTFDSALLQRARSGERRQGRHVQATRAPRSKSPAHDSALRPVAPTPPHASASGQPHITSPRQSMLHLRQQQEAQHGPPISLRSPTEVMYGEFLPATTASLDRGRMAGFDAQVHERMERARQLAPKR